MNTRLYFAYGSNMWTDQMKRRCPCSTVIGLGMLCGYRWIISARGYANIIASTRDDVYGIIYSISETDELSLDVYEGVAAGSYLKQHVTVLIEGNEVKCLVYIDPVTIEGRPHDEYVGRINNGIEDARLPADYVARNIRRFIPA